MQNFFYSYDIVPYDDIDALEALLKNPNTCAFMVEPIQGKISYVSGVQDLHLKVIKGTLTKFKHF